MSTVTINAAATITVGKVPRQWIDRRIRDFKRFLHRWEQCPRDSGEHPFTCEDGPLIRRMEHRCQWIRHDVCAIVVLLLGCEPDPLCLTVAR